MNFLIFFLFSNFAFFVFSGVEDLFYFLFFLFSGFSFIFVGRRTVQGLAFKSTCKFAVCKITGLSFETTGWGPANKEREHC